MATAVGAGLTAVGAGVVVPIACFGGTRPWLDRRWRRRSRHWRGCGGAVAYSGYQTSGRRWRDVVVPVACFEGFTRP
jgi:hypothetical protein